LKSLVYNLVGHVLNCASQWSVPNSLRDITPSPKRQVITRGHTRSFRSSSEGTSRSSGHHQRAYQEIQVIIIGHIKKFRSSPEGTSRNSGHHQKAHQEIQVITRRHIKMFRSSPDETF
jgi:hypothetical protein